MNKNLIPWFVFVLSVLGMMWLMPIPKIETIGDFFEKIIRPIAFPISLALASRFGIIKYFEYRRKESEEVDN